MAQIKITQTSNADMNIGVTKNLTMAQDTALDFLLEKMSILGIIYAEGNKLIEINKFIKQAKAMEKEQIVKAYISADLMEGRANLSDAEQYYNQTYQSNQDKPNN